jgi:Flp pilus assembly protein TadG
MIGRIVSLLKRLRTATSGLAVVEFALTAPVMIVLITYGLEASNIAISRVRIQTMTSGAADNAARIRESIDETDIIELLSGAKSVGSNLDFANRGRLIISSVQRNAADNGLEIVWQRCDGAQNYVSSIGLEGKGKTDNTLQTVGYTKPGGPTVSVSPKAGTVMIFVETAYNYKALFGDYLYGAQTFKDYRAYIVRQRSNNVPTNSTAVTKKLCTVFSA